jgi:hypothetical protein
MKRLLILTAVAMLTATACGCANRRNHCAPPMPAAAPACDTSGAYLGSPGGGVYTGPGGYLPTPN